MVVEEDVQISNTITFPLRKIIVIIIVIISNRNDIKITEDKIIIIDRIVPDIIMIMMVVVLSNIMNQFELLINKDKKTRIETEIEVIEEKSHISIVKEIKYCMRLNFRKPEKWNLQIQINWLIFKELKVIISAAGPLKIQFLYIKL